MSDPPGWMRLHPQVAAALSEGQPVVALESTVITHGLEKPVNLDIALRMEADIRAQGAIPATVGVIEGQVILGLDEAELERLALGEGAHKLTSRDLAWARAAGVDGGTTVSATMRVAHAAGVRVFATGGIGGVHRGQQGDVSLDLTELGRTPVAVVCAGAKAVLDLPRTLEWLETAGVPVLGWRTDAFPAFFSRRSGLPVSARVDTPDMAAALLSNHWEMGMAGALICVPCPQDVALDPQEVERAVAQALRAAEGENVRGKKLTPFLLAYLAQASGWQTVRANLALLRENARVAALIATALPAAPG
jgi:pseudouridine-5'-phosphate glycosidase